MTTSTLTPPNTDTDNIDNDIDVELQTASQSRADQTGRAEPHPEQPTASEGNGDTAPPRPPQPPTHKGHGRGGRGHKPLPGWARFLIRLFSLILAFTAGATISILTNRLIRRLEHP